MRRTPKENSSICCAMRCRFCCRFSRQSPIFDVSESGTDARFPSEVRQFVVILDPTESDGVAVVPSDGLIRDQTGASSGPRILRAGFMNRARACVAGSKRIAHQLVPPGAPRGRKDPGMSVVAKRDNACHSSSQVSVAGRSARRRQATDGASGIPSHGAVTYATEPRVPLGA